MNNEDPFAIARPQNPNEKPEPDPNDPFFSFRPEPIKNQYKKTIYDTPEVTKEELQKMSPEERYALLQEMKTEREYRQSAGFTKGAISGATFGLSKKIPGLKPEEGEFLTGFGEFLGSTIPITGIYNVLGKPLVKLASKSPVAADALKSLASMTGWGLTGATEKGIKDSFQGKIPSAEDILVHGSEWAAFDAALQTLGLGGKFAKWVLGKSENTKKASWEVINDLINDMKKEGIDISQTDRVNAKVQSLFEKQPLEASGKEINLSKEPPPSKTELATKEVFEKMPEKQKIDLSNKKISEDELHKIEDKILPIKEPIKPEEIDAEQAIKNIEESAFESEFEKISPRSETEKKLGETIKQDIENSFIESEKSYEPLYKEVDVAAKNIYHKPSNTISTAKTILEDINSLKTKPEGYKKVIDTLNDSLNDLGYHIFESNNKFIIRDPSGNVIKGKSLEILENIPLSNSIELAKRLNKIINYDIVGPSIKNRLKPLVSTLKNEIKQILEVNNSELAKKFIKAEKSFGETAEKFGNDFVTKLRTVENPEKIVNELLEPSNLEKLQKILSKKQYNQIEREILEKLKDLSYDKIKKNYREIKPFISDTSKNIVESLIDSKYPLSKKVTGKNLKTGIIEDLNTSFSTGNRPSKTLELWKTKKGRDLIKQSLEKTPNEKEIVNYLKKQSIYDIAQSFVKENGTVDFEKLSNILKESEFLNNIKEIGGLEAVNFFKSLEKITSSMKKNINILEKLPNVKLYPAEGQYALGKERLQKLFKDKDLTKIKTKKTFGKIPKKEKGQTHEKGKQILKEMAKQKAPIKFKLDQIAEKLNLSDPVKDILKMLGIVKFSGVVAAGIGAKLIYNLISRPNSRKSIYRVMNNLKSASYEPHNITPFLINLMKMEEDFSR